MTEPSTVATPEGSPMPGHDSGDYVTSVEPGVLASVKEELARKEEQQQRHYLYLSELQRMIRELPGSMQQRMPYDLLSAMANALLDGTVFEIVGSLKEVQKIEERNLSKQRMKLISEHKMKKQILQRKHRDAVNECHSKPHNLPYVQERSSQEMQAFSSSCEEEVKRCDMKTIMELDQKVMEQQGMLEKAGVPGFFVTNNSNDVRLQIYLLDFIGRLNQLNPTD